MTTARELLEGVVTWMEEIDSFGGHDFDVIKMEELRQSIKAYLAKPPRESTTRFVKPTPSEVTAYAKSIGFDLDGQYFVDSNEAKGWKVGETKTPMKDWKAVVRTWKHNQQKKNKPQQKPNFGW